MGAADDQGRSREGDDASAQSRSLGAAQSQSFALHAFHHSSGGQNLPLRGHHRVGRLASGVAEQGGGLAFCAPEPLGQDQVSMPAKTVGGVAREQVLLRRRDHCQGDGGTSCGGFAAVCGVARRGRRVAAAESPERCAVVRRPVRDNDSIAGRTASAAALHAAATAWGDPQADQYCFRSRRGVPLNASGGIWEAPR